MYVILSPIRKLPSRGDEIRKLLQPIAKHEDGPAWQPIASSREYIIGTHDGSPSQSNYRDWRFSTYVPQIHASYFEFWKKTFVDKKEIWYLDRAYLHIYRINLLTRGEEEFLALHCDPNESQEAEHVLYKRGPHLHIKVAQKPIPHAHIALNLGHLKEVLGSVEALSKAMKMGVQMLREEILDAMSREMNQQ